MYRLIPSRTNRLLLVLSDLEMAAGGPLDDLPSTALVESILDGYDDLDDLPVDLVLNGDIFDFLKTSVEGVYPHHITQDIALQKLDRIVTAHGSFFDTLREFIDVSPTRRRIVFLVGNHDQEMCFPEVQEGIRKAVGRKQLLFPGFSWKMGRVWIEHGQQKDSMFAVDPEKPFLVKDDDIILNLPWGSVAVCNQRSSHCNAGCITLIG